MDLLLPGGRDDLFTGPGIGQNNFFALLLNPLFRIADRQVNATEKMRGNLEDTIGIGSFELGQLVCEFLALLPGLGELGFKKAYLVFRQFPFFLQAVSFSGGNLSILMLQISVDLLDTIPQAGYFTFQFGQPGLGPEQFSGQERVTAQNDLGGGGPSGAEDRGIQGVSRRAAAPHQYGIFMAENDILSGHDVTVQG